MSISPAMFVILIGLMFIGALLIFIWAVSYLKDGRQSRRSIYETYDPTVNGNMYDENGLFLTKDNPL